MSKKAAADDPEVARLLAEADAIANGGKPGDAPPSPPPGSAGTVGGDPADGPASPSAPPVDPRLLAGLLVTAVDMLAGAVTGLGAAAHMQAPLREEAVTAWARVLEAYAPALQTVGPVGALVTVYGIHFAGLAAGAAWQAGDSVPELSVGTAQAKQL